MRLALLLVALLAGCATVPPAGKSASPEGDREVSDADVAPTVPDRSWRLP